jgi:hypothetical protein
MASCSELALQLGTGMFTTGQQSYGRCCKLCISWRPQGYAQASTS